VLHVPPVPPPPSLVPIRTRFILILSIIVIDFCRDMKFKEIARNKALANHTLRTIWPIIDLETCVSECYMDIRCITVNLCEKSDNTMTCNLLDSDHIRSKNAMVDKQGCSHYGTEAREMFSLIYLHVLCLCMNHKIFVCVCVGRGGKQKQNKNRSRPLNK